MKFDEHSTENPLLSANIYPTLRKELRSWWKINKRKFYWRQSNDPYDIFIAEMMLQKTQVAKVEPKYLEFIKEYPNIEALLLASPEKINEVFAWLGLVKRAGYLTRAVKIIVDEYGGIIPKDANELIELPGVGDYTANAILCFAYGKARPIVDTSIARLLYRLLGYRSRKKAWEDEALWEIAAKFLDRKYPQEHNYALIDLAAIICLPIEPICFDCPLKQWCKYANGLLN